MSLLFHHGNGKNAYDPYMGHTNGKELMKFSNHLYFIHILLSFSNFLIFSCFCGKKGFIFDTFSLCSTLLLKSTRRRFFFSRSDLYFCINLLHQFSTPKHLEAFFLYKFPNLKPIKLCYLHLEEDKLMFYSILSYNFLKNIHIFNTFCM